MQSKDAVQMSAPQNEANLKWAVWVLHDQCERESKWLPGQDERFFVYWRAD